MHVSLTASESLGTDRLHEHEELGFCSPAFWLPVVLEGQLDLLLEDVRHEGLVVGPVLALHLHQQLLVHRGGL